MSRILTIGLVVALSACRSFPESRDVDRFLVDLPKVADTEARYSGFRALVGSISNPDSVAEDQLAEATLSRLAEYYSTSGDDTLLRAVDEARADSKGRNAGFGNMVCGFYSHAIQSPSARARYSANCGPLEGCIGISFSREDLKPICNG
jgi:hypothetical protein